MKTGWLIYSEPDAVKNTSFIDWLKEEASLGGLSLELMYAERFAFGITENRLSLYYDLTETELPSFAIVRTIQPLLSRQLEAMGLKLFNPSAVSSVANDKARTHQFLAGAGIPMMDTLFIHPSIFQIQSMPFTFPLVAKLASGRGGEQVHLVKTERELADALSTHPEQEWILQKLAPDAGKDIRVFVVGNKIAGAVLRSSANDFRANYSLGGMAQFYHLNPAQTALVEQVISYFDIGMAGIDFLLDEKEAFIFNEVEDVVGSRTLSATSDINIARLYMEHIAAKLKKPESE
ncbi:ATP-grasp domain-containing protein [Fictibacillus fluitans]|uniref:ATP-grasp domain-containing protein n=1 Tax=Fictibacillus fluitans TaxID=3058422 RepID=A0ABT8HZM2_9BACL|nr:ATP-grasp domain-containing protein [Fictibacillus sp. NE201]MDN4526226.1 ATP-grasp domain-containing protein [Fictibacillus sp. NE201]